MHPYSRASIASALSSRTLSLHGALGRSKSSRENLLMHAHAALLRWLISCVSSPSSLTRPPKYRNWVLALSIVLVCTGTNDNNTYEFKHEVVVVVDSHIQRIVLATEETTVTQQVSHRPIKRQSRLWSQRGTKVNGSHHGDNPLLRPTGIQIATKSYAALQAMAPTNTKTVHQTSLLHSRATSIDSECCRLPTTSVLSKKPEKLRSNQF